MIYGDNYVEVYSPVEAYSVNSRSARIISGGSGDDAVISQGTRFLWRYDPDNPDNSGFTGYGWFADEPNTPLATFGNDDAVNQAFANEEISNLNTYFAAWQELINSTPDNTYVQSFLIKIAFAAGSEEAAAACYESIG